MSTCRSCSDARTTDRPLRTSLNPRSAALVLRVWHEDGLLRCRLLDATSGASSLVTLTAIAGPDAICDAVREWLATI